MSDKRPSIEDRLATLIFHVDKEAHITVRKEQCVKCVERPCLTICPANNYEWDREKGQLVFSYEGCLECGSCRFMCEAIEWSYPRGGFGVTYRCG